MNHENLKQAIWTNVSAIPKGKVTTYGQIARMAGFPNHARYVGHTLKNLPSDSNLPWHRVVNGCGRISFPVNSEIYRLQLKLLKSEGIYLVADKISLKDYLWQI